ncbi:MAG TPA: hypothetical protein VNI78_09675 [Vicinamibacterales bacterium]|nr:hypothetical protein [Vicinamibacterales bacterium]
MPDFARDPAVLKRGRLRRAGYGLLGVLVLVAVSIALARMDADANDALAK